MLLALKSHNVFGAFLSMSVFGYVAANYTLAEGVVCFFSKMTMIRSFNLGNTDVLNIDLGRGKFLTDYLYST